MDIVIQGGLWDTTWATAVSYAELDLVGDVVISTWAKPDAAEWLSRVDPHPKIKWVLSPWPENHFSQSLSEASGNMNAQIVSTLAGIKQCSGSCVLKVRSDMIITSYSLERLQRFFDVWCFKHSLEYEDGGGPSGLIFPIGVMKTMPYHPADQVIMGFIEDMQDLFTCPPLPENCPKRNEIWLGGNYFARFNSEVQNHLADPDTYLQDGAPKYDEAMELYHTMREQVFHPLPRFDLQWVKYKSGYWYHEYEPQGAYYHDEGW